MVKAPEQSKSPFLVWVEVCGSGVDVVYGDVCTLLGLGCRVQVPRGYRGKIARDNAATVAFSTAMSLQLGTLAYLGRAKVKKEPLI